jgi:hypothetical protein
MVSSVLLMNHLLPWIVLDPCCSRLSHEYTTLLLCRFMPRIMKYATENKDEFRRSGDPHQTGLGGTCKEPQRSERGC